MGTRFTTRTGVAACLVSLVASGAVASVKPPPMSRHQPRITAALADPEAGTLTVFGENFRAGGRFLNVTLGEFGPLAVTLDTDTVIGATLPDGIAPGDYLLTVVTGHGESRVDQFDLTIGGAGPAGPPGPEGPQGENLSLRYLRGALEAEGHQVSQADFDGPEDWERVAATIATSDGGECANA